ncbi:MAG TPA: DNRLRE domain-containing protein [Gaiellaceae bacterium]|nr:DNRLRE domain-containing protein [Gaiellaceae bacterium]
MKTLRRTLVLLAALTGVGTAAGYAATLPVGSLHLWGGAQTLTKGTCTLSGSTQTSDTYVQQDHATTSSGSATTMNVQSASGKLHAVFVSFDLSSCNLPATGGADSATLSLRLTTHPVQNRVLTVTPVTSQWTESLTWTDAVGLGYGATTTTVETGTKNNVTLAIPVTVDVDAKIKSSSANYGWAIDDLGAVSGTQTSTFASSENGTSANRPTLTINYEK